MRYTMQVGLLAMVLAMVGCSGDGKWTVKGTVSDADGMTLVLETSDNELWYAIDSVKLNDNGRFEMSQAQKGNPNIFRLRLADKYVYFPIDSIETVTVNANGKAFDTDYTLDGTDEAKMFMEVDRKLRDALAKEGYDGLVNDSLLKRDLGNMVITNGAGMLAYYIINKSYGGKPLFNPANKSDLKIIGAVANAYDQARPADPRTEFLKKLFISHRKAEIAGKGIAASDTIRANEVGAFDIELYDCNGKKRSLLEQSKDGGKLVVLNFTVFATDASPEYNRKLYDVYKKYHDRGLEIYQVCIDDDEPSWRQAARNLPWVAVHTTPATGSRHLMDYNVTEVPVSFVIDRNGVIVERVEDVNSLGSAVSRHI